MVKASNVPKAVSSERDPLNQNANTSALPLTSPSLNIPEEPKSKSKSNEPFRKYHQMKARKLRKFYSRQM